MDWVLWPSSPSSAHTQPHPVRLVARGQVSHCSSRLYPPWLSLASASAWAPEDGWESPGIARVVPEQPEPDDEEKTESFQPWLKQLPKSEEPGVASSSSVLWAPQALTSSCATKQPGMGTGSSWLSLPYRCALGPPAAREHNSKEQADLALFRAWTSNIKCKSRLKMQRLALISFLGLIFTVQLNLISFFYLMVYSTF